MLRDYAAGIVTAAAPAWMFSALVLTTPLDDAVALLTLSFIVTAAGGALGGFLSARHRFEKPLRMAAFSGIGSYALLAIANWMMRINSIYDMAAIVGFPVGFAIGSRIIELRRAQGK